MKKILSILTLSTAAVIAGYSQGFVNTETISSTYAVSTNGGFGKFGETFGAVADTGGQAYDYALLYSATLIAAVEMGSSAQTVNAWAVGPAMVNGPQPGSIFGSVSAAMGNPATTYYIEIVGWSTGLGASFANLESTIENGYFPPIAGQYLGFSNVGQVTTASSPAPGTTIFSPTGISSGFVLESEPIPETSTIALGVMGAVSLLALRRKKA